MPIETANKNSKRKNPERATPEEETSINQHIEYEQRRNNRLKDDTVDYAQQDNAILNEANSKDVDQQASKINEDQEHYDDVEERTFYLTRKFLKACLQRSKTKKKLQSDDDAAEQSHSHMELTDSNLNNEEDRTQPHLKDTFDYDGTSTIKRGRSRQQRLGKKLRDKTFPSSKGRHSKQPTSSSDMQ
uniref:Uncharacterized protein n=1 Tax=Solanum tuberosum TaxID=4113 RepID=M1DCX2_SOLTU